MTRTTLQALLDTHPVLVADGGMGTSLFASGLESGDSPEGWNTERPEVIVQIHETFVAAGADIILTNTFGGNRSRLALHGHQDRVAELNVAGARLARQVADGADRPVVVGGSIGPTGDLFEPHGTLTHASAVQMFGDQAKALAEGGVDVLWIETMSTIEELEAAAEAAATTELPIVTTMSFDTNGHTMMGVTPDDLAATRLGTGAVAIGVNCGIGPGDNVLAAGGVVNADPDAIVVSKGNCGMPAYIDGYLDYPIGPELMAAYAELAMRAGARIIGACCGSTPAHIAEIRETVDHYQGDRSRPARQEIDVRLGVSFLADQPVRRRRQRRRAERAG